MGVKIQVPDAGKACPRESKRSPEDRPRVYPRQSELPPMRNRLLVAAGCPPDVQSGHVRQRAGTTARTTVAGSVAGSAGWSGLGGPSDEGSDLTRPLGAQRSRAPTSFCQRAPFPLPREGGDYPLGSELPPVWGNARLSPPAGMLLETPVFPSRGFGDLARDPAGHLPASRRELKAQRLIPTTKLSRNTGDTERLPADSGGEHFRGGCRRPLNGLGAAGLSLCMMQRLTFRPPKEAVGICGQIRADPRPPCAPVPARLAVVPQHPRVHVVLRLELHSGRRVKSRQRPAA